MKEKPILFSTEMVRAILDGRKAQTRRVIKPQPAWGEVITEQEAKDRALSGFDPYGFRINTPTQAEATRKAPCQPGDILWVRETCAKVGPVWVYRADDNDQIVHTMRTLGTEHDDDRWRPSIHMPREAARIFLKVKDVRVEQVCDISTNDIIAEGVLDGEAQGLVYEFSKLWNNIYAKRGYGWNKNPWVWVVEFERTL